MQFFFLKNLANFITRRKNLRELIFDSNNKTENLSFFNNLLDFVIVLIKTNEYEDTNENKVLLDTLKKVEYVKNSETNSHILLYNTLSQKYVYINENLFNLCIYLILKCSFIDNSNETKHKNLIEFLLTVEYINCSSLKMVLNELNKYELMHCSTNLSDIYLNYINKVLNFDEAVASIYSYYGLPVHIIKLLLNKIDLNEENLSIDDFNNVCMRLNVKKNSLIEILKLYIEEVEFDFKSTNKFLGLLIDSEVILDESKNIKTFYLNTNTDESINMDVDLEETVLTTSLTDNHLVVIHEQNSLCDNILKLFEQKQHDQLIIKTKNLKLNNEQNSNSELISQLNHLTQIPANLQTLNEKLVYLVDLLYELTCNTKVNNIEILIKNFFFFTNNSLINNERVLIIIKFLLKYEYKFEENSSIVEMLIDLYVKLDKQIINKQVDFEKDELVFGKRFPCRLQPANKLQTFLILLLTHQANWTILNDCVHRLLDRKKKKNFKLYSKIVLDFLWSLIHIPTLWRGMDSVNKLVLYKEDCILDLNENELYSLIDFICDEILNESKSNDVNKELQIKYLFKKRIQLLQHFLNNNKKKKFVVEMLAVYLQLNVTDLMNNDIFDFNDFNE